MREVKELEAISEHVVGNGITVKRLKPLPELEQFDGRYVTEIRDCHGCGEPTLIWDWTGRSDDEECADFSRVFPEALRARGVAMLGTHDCQKDETGG